jgi:cytochrome P450 family 109
VGDHDAQEGVDTQQATLVVPPLPCRPEEIAHVIEWFARMRDAHPIVPMEWDGVEWWHVFRYDDVATVLTDHARFSSRVPQLERGPLSDTMLVSDPPNHRRLRNLVSMAFAPRAIAGLSGRIAELAQRLLDRVRARGAMDLVADLALPLPTQVICELLGVPESDWADLQSWTCAGAPVELSRLYDYFRDLLQERRRSPRRDLVSLLSATGPDGERSSERDQVNSCLLLLAAGTDTTRNLIANFCLTMSHHPDDLARLTRDLALVPSAVEEVLRVLPPVWFVMRRATVDVELGSVRIPAGGLVMPWMASANRDATQFPDPDRFDVAREPNRHLGFGQGVHFCVGSPLARLEAGVVLPMLLDQVKDLRVDRAWPIRIVAGAVFAVTSLPVTFRPY